MKTLRPSTEPKRERERPTEDEERGWSTHVREAFPPRGTGGGAHHLLVAPSAPSFHPRFFRPMAKRCPPPPPPPPPARTDTGSRAAANAASLQAKKGASKKKVRPHAQLENRYVSVSCRLTRNQILLRPIFVPSHLAAAQHRRSQERKERKERCWRGEEVPGKVRQGPRLLRAPAPTARTHARTHTSVKN